VAGLRADLAAAQGQGEAVAALSERVAALDGRLSAAAATLDATVADPGPLIDRAVDRAADQIRSGLAACTAEGS
jgi:hypothetical protein